MTLTLKGLLLQLVFSFRCNEYVWFNIGICCHVSVCHNKNLQTVSKKFKYKIHHVRIAKQYISKCDVGVSVDQIRYFSGKNQNVKIDILENIVKKFIKRKKIRIYNYLKFV